MTKTLSQRSLEAVAELISDADALIIAAGAGMGVDSGLPDFRSKDGFWKAYPALGWDDIDFVSIACPDAFRTQPRRAWGFYGHRLNLYRRTQPHPGFQILKRWGDNMPLGCAVFTSNIDGQFQKAGFDDSPIHECHGSIHHLQCLLPCCNTIWSADGFEPEVDVENCQLVSELPKCPQCGGPARPNVLMFGDWQWLGHRHGEQAANLAGWLNDVKMPLIIELGAGTLIPSVRVFSELMAHNFCGRLVRINPSDSAVPTQWDVGLACGAGFALAEIDRLVQAGQGTN